MSTSPSAPVSKHLPSPGELPFPVVGIGASAGGVQALKRLFETMPPDCGMAFVIVVHLSPTHASLLDSILQPLTDMPVIQVTQPTAIEKNRVYVISPAVDLSMRDGHLRVSPAARAHGQHVVIDNFFRTLAEAHRARAVGIVLTGGGSDGAVGLSRIKELGGVTLAQQPEDAEHDTMPRSAIATGMVDIILPVADMAARLKNIADNQRRIEMPGLSAEQEVERAATAENTDTEEAALRDILTLLLKRTAHDFKHYKKATVLRRIERRMQVTGVPDMRSYARLLDATPDETPLLLSDMLIGVTNFFRDHEAFAALAQAVVPELFKRHGEQSLSAELRVWTPGCATGEEAYSMAMLLCEEAERQPAPPAIQLFASDIDEHALATARAGLYSAAIATDVAAERLDSYFVPEGATGYRVRKEIRDLVLFAKHNILRDPPFSRLDLISCRNLLIYLDRSVQAYILRTFHFALKPGGYLFLGNSESVDACKDLFAVVDKRNRIYQAKVTSAAGLRNPTPLMSTPDAIRTPPLARSDAQNRVSLAELHHSALEQYAPPSVIVDHDGNILHMSEGAGRFLRHAGGEPSRKLPALVYPELRVELRTAMWQALHTHRAVEAQRVKMNIGERDTCIQIVVRPFRHDETRGDFMLVIFDEVENLASAGNTATEGPGDSLLAQLEADLAATKDQLQLRIEQSETSNEALKASNEELQAINEELRSATEELETGKEELQSINEELVTVNTELRAKVEQTAKINDDLQNLIASTDIATVFVDRAMSIKWFTPRAAQIFCLIPSDAGRSLLDISHRLDYPQLAQDAAEVFESLRTKECEVASRNGHWYLARLLPYRSADDRIEGAVLTFIDISARRRAEERLALGETHMRLLAQSTRDFAIITIDEDGLIATWNGGAEVMFGYSADEARGQPIDIIFTPEDLEQGEPRNEMERARRTGFASDERWHRRKDGSRLFCTGSVTSMKDDVFRGYGKIARDITIQKRQQSEQETQLELTQADSNLKDEFFAVMSHELKHPLNLIQLNAELLARSPGVKASASSARAAEAIQHSVKSQARIIEDLLDLSRVRTGKLKLNRSAVSLCTTVDSIVDVLRPTARASGVELRTDYDSTKPILLQADPVRIEQIVWNLLSNGINFTPDGGTVSVSLCCEGPMARLDVVDTGQGIDGAFLDKVFDMFSQAEMRHSGSKRIGLGIGLAIVHHLVSAHGGRIEAASDGPGKGTHFTVWLPLGEGDAAGGDSTADEQNGQLAGFNILVVDDSEEILEVFRTLLEMESANVLPASSGEQALDAVAHSTFDLIISDIGMPGMDGYQFLEALRARFPELRTPVVALTGYGSKQEVKRAADAGFVAHLTKPVTMSAVLETLHRVMQRP